MNHQMIFVERKPSGYEEWYCPECGRRFLMTWPPDYQKIVLEPGDPDAIHNVLKGMEELTSYVGGMDIVVQKDPLEWQEDNPFAEWAEKNSNLFDFED